MTNSVDTASATPIKLAFISPFNLFDRANGAAQSVRTMLEKLSEENYHCEALTACCFEGAGVNQTAGILSQHGLVQDGIIEACNLPVWRGKVNGIHFNAIALPVIQRDFLTAFGELIFRDTVNAWLDQHKPDMVLTFGGYLLDIELQRCAKAAGAKVVFYLANTRYARVETFSHVDLIVTNSAATAAHYKKTLGLDCHNIGLFVDPLAVRADEREPTYVTLVNPLPEKGVTLFLKLVERASIEMKEMRFLVVESRGVLSLAVQQMQLSPASIKNVTVLPIQENMLPVYRKTRILLVPSFWFESAGRVLIEANANGIPVLAADTGGIPETLGLSERVLPIPEKCKLNHWAVPDPDELEPWWQALKKLWVDDVAYQEASRQALEMAGKQSISLKVQRLSTLLKAL